MTENVVLVDKNNIPLGIMPKSQVHTANTPLHRAFSCFLFTPKGQLLLQQRAKSKKTWPLVWSNSCCGHPLPNESNTHAVIRRLKFELGLKNIPMLEEILPNFTYKAVKDGIMEHEICPVFIGFTSERPNINPSEVESIQYVPWQEIITSILDENDTKWQHLSVWCREEMQLLHENKRFNQLFEKHTN